MIYPTPVQSDLVTKSNWPTIRQEFHEYETTFVLLHPFLKIKKDCEIKFETGNWPSKKEILDCTVALSWNYIIEQSALKDISELDRLLAYLHCDRRIADRTGWIQMCSFLDKNNIIPAEVDYVPSIIENELITAIASLNYQKLVEYTMVDVFKVEHSIENILASKERSFNSVARIASPDKKILITTDFDQRFSYLSSTKEITDHIITIANLEGFYCNETTKSNWSDIILTENVIDWHSPERYQEY